MRELDVELFNASCDGNVALVAWALGAGAYVDYVSETGSTPLYTVAFDGHTAVVEKLLAAGANPDIRKADGSTALFAAAQNGHIAIVEKLLAANANIDIPMNSGATPLYMAAQSDQLEMLEMLLKAGASVDLAQENGATPLVVAAERDLLSIVERLIAAGAAVNITKKDGATALLAAAQNGQLTAVEKLIAAGANVDLGMHDGVTPIYMAALRGHTAIVGTLLAAKANTNLRRNDGTSPLGMAAYNGHAAIVEMLLSAGSNVDFVDNDGDSPLICAAMNGHDGIARILISAGAHASIRNKQGRTAADIFESNGNTTIAWLLRGHKPTLSTFFGAVERGNLDVVRRIIHARFVSARGDHARTPMHQAAKYGRADVIRVLFDNGASLADRDDKGWTPLHAASAEGQVNAIRLLMRRRANAALLDDQGLSCADIGAMHGHLDVVKLFVERGATLTSQAIDGRTVLHHGVLGRNPSLVEYLLRNAHADVNATDGRGRTVLHYLVQSMSNRLEVAQVKDRMKQQQTSSGEDSEDANQIAILRLLLGVDGIIVDAQDHTGSSALLEASEHGHSQAVRWLLDHGARADIADNSGRTPLSVVRSLDVQSVLLMYHNSQKFHDQCFALINDKDTPPTPDQIVDLVPLITSVYDLRMMITLAGLSVDPSCLPTVIKPALKHVIAKKLTLDDDACVFFKLILERCVADKTISREDFLLFDRKAEKANTESADWVIEMKKQVYTNSWRLDGHDQHLRSVVDGVKNVHAMVLQNRAAIVATATRVEQLKSQVIAGKKMMAKLMMHTKHSSAQMTHLQTELARTNDNIKHVATHLTNFRDAYTSRLEHEEKTKRIKTVCGIVASVAGFVIGPVLKEISDVVVDLANPLEIVSNIYGEEDIAGFLAEQSDKLLPEVIQSQLEKYAIPQDEFETLLREEIALLHPEVVAECEERGLTLHVDGGRSDVVNAVVTPILEAEETAVVELLRDLRIAVTEGSSKKDAADTEPRPSAQDRLNTVGASRLGGVALVSSTDTSTDSVQPMKPDSNRGIPLTRSRDEGTSSTPRFEPVQSTRTGVTEQTSTVNAPSNSYHAAVEQSRGDLSSFQNLISTLSTQDEDVNFTTAVQVRSAQKSREKLCAAEYAYARGYQAVGEYLASRMSQPQNLQTSRAVSVVLAEPVEAFAYVCIVDESHGDVAECAELCELMDEEEHSLALAIQADVEREAVVSFTWTPVELACHLGYVEVAKFMLKELCKKMSVKQKIEMLKRARERAAAGAAA